MYLTIDIADPLGTSYLHMSQPERWLLYFLPKPQPMSVFCHKERERERERESFKVKTHSYLQSLKSTITF